ncbi:MAG TPA: ATP-binding protein [Rickettsiales bacterium]|nr:ATP-binding protein [Rickettsiales bacterium]
MNIRSIYFRLILWYSGLVVLLALVFAGYLYRGLEVRLYAQMEHTLARRAHQIAYDILPLNANAPAMLAKQIEDVYSPEANNRFIRISEGGGNVVYRSGVPKDGGFNPQMIPQSGAYTPPRRMVPIADGSDMLVVAVPSEVQRRHLVVEMGFATNDVKATLDGLLAILLLGLPAVILIVSVGGYVLVRRTLRPVENMRAKAEKITFGNLSNRLPVAETGDELEHLAVTLNQMLGRLDDAYQQASRFSADASHELRTPLAIMRGELESIAQDEALSGTQCERIGSVLEEVERLSRIAENLLAISRLDAGEAKIAHERFDLAALVKGTVEQMALLAEEKRIRLTVKVEGPAELYGDRAKIKQVVVNLLDNAIKYTQEDGSVMIHAYAQQGKAILEIIDNGIGIPAAELPHIFERFYRADKVRSRQMGGAGLGLSIVRAICQAHGGTVEMMSTEGKGSACRVELPLAAAETA